VNLRSLYFLYTMSDLSRPFIPGQPYVESLPLGRYLPPLPAEMASNILRQAFPPGSWLLDPLAATPALALEAASNGYRILVTSNNPVISFILEELASSPQASDFQGALSELSMIRRGDERLDTHLQSLYLTECASCGQIVPAQVFLWRKDEDKPYARVYHCPMCGDEGERPITPNDLERLQIPGNASLHRARALERISLGQNELQASAEEALNAYLPRQLYFLFTLINKIEGLSITEERRRCLIALVLSVCDEANTLWPWPAGRTRPRQISTASQYRENNLWLALEAAISTWCRSSAQIPLTIWPELPPAEGGICLFRGRLKTILPLMDKLDIKGALCVFPRPNQAFWTLSALWSGWLWGKEAVLPLKGSLERRRYDWQWHASALYSPLSALRKDLPPNFPLYGVLPELAPGFLSAVLTANEAAGFKLSGFAMRSDEELAQGVWESGPVEKTTKSQSPDLICRTAIQTELTDRNQPSDYLTLFTAGMITLEQAGQILAQPGLIAADTLTRIQACIGNIFADQAFLKHYERNVKSNESGLWGLLSPGNSNNLPLADRIEMELVRYLQKHPGSSLVELDEALCTLFPGLATPTMDFILACLDSYAEQVPNSSRGWQLRLQENPNARRLELQTIRNILENCGHRLKYIVSGDNPVVWTTANNQPGYHFFLQASSIISRFVLSPGEADPKHCVLVLPGSRSRLLAYKLRKDPHLAEVTAAGWHFLKFRHLRQLNDRAELNRKLWDDLLDTDQPLLEEATQMSMFQE
jgi:hypothetical protein